MHDDDQNTRKYISSHHPRIMSQSHLTVSQEAKHVMGTQHLFFRSDFLFCQFCASCVPDVYTSQQRVKGLELGAATWVLGIKPGPLQEQPCESLLMKNSLRMFPDEYSLLFA